MRKKTIPFLRNRTDYFVFGGLCLLFGYFLFFNEVRELSDSFQYLNQFVSREPVYALLLQGLTVLFGESYTIHLSLIQNGLAVIGIYWLYYRLTSLFKMNPLFQAATAIALVSPHVITPYAAKSGMIITNSVLTEGIALSLYYIWAGMILTLILGKYEKNRNRVIVLTMLFSVFLSMIRGQLMICIIVWMLAAVFRLAVDKQYKPIIFVIIGFVLCFAGKTQLTKLYNYLESGLYVNTVSSKPMILSNLVYLSDEEDGAGIEDEALKQTYENIVSEVKDQGLSVENAKGTIIERAQFHEFGHETINFDIIVPNLKRYIAEKDGIDENEYFELLIKLDEYAGAIFKKAFPSALPAFLKNYFVIASLGFVRSVAIDKGMLSYFAVLLYIVAIGLVLYLLRKDWKNPAAWFMIFVLVLICGTVFGTSIMIECISRYMIYNLPLFYIAGMTMLEEIRKG